VQLWHRIVTVPLWIPTYSERDALVVLEIGLLFERISNTEFKRTLVFVPVELGEVVADEAMQVVSVGSVAPVARRTGFPLDRRVACVVLISKREERPPRFRVLASDLLTDGFAEDGCVVIGEVGILSIYIVPYVFLAVKVGLAASVRDLIPQRSVGGGGQPLEQALPAPLADRRGSILVRSLWQVAH
jgi:hypothetical protein